MESQKFVFMRRALELASHGQGQVSPNPMVGCVIVKNDKVIGEGWHEKYGEGHAEVNAINSVADKSMLEGADLYVNLEPCAHYGKTPPCADLIVQYPFRKVYIANTDPFSLVDGKGIEKLESAGIEVEIGLLAEEGYLLNIRFFTNVNHNRPYVILKWACTSDGFIARKDYSSKWISGDVSRILVHKWRSEEDGIMVGTSTALYDNPELNVRLWHGRNPLRIVIDCQLKLPRNLLLFNDVAKTIVFNNIKNELKDNIEWVKVEGDKIMVAQILEVLHARKVQSILVEGGAKLLQAFIDCGLWDEARIFRAPVYFEEGISAPVISGNIMCREMIGEDELTYLRRRIIGK